MKTILAGTALLLVLSTSCDKRPDFRLREFGAATRAYCTNDIRGAESAMMQHYQRLLSWRQKDVQGVDYDVALATATGRLFLIYDRMGDKANCDRFLAEAARYFNRRLISIGRAPRAFTGVDLKKEIEALDAGLSVGWKEKP